LNSKRKTSKRKDSTVSGEILLQFSLADSANPAATPPEIYRKFKKLVYSGDEDDQIIPPPDFDDLEQDEQDDENETFDEADEAAGGPEVGEKRRRRLRLARLRRKSLAARAYQFSGTGTGVHGIVFMEIVRVTDLPPERNGMDLSFCMQNARC
jgi:phosphatidylserine decarboxylase